MAAPTVGERIASGGTPPKAFSLRRRWPANGGSDEVSAPSGACPKDKRNGLHHRKRIATPVCALARNDGVMWKLPRFPTDSPRPGLRRDTELLYDCHWQS